MTKRYKTWAERATYFEQLRDQGGDGSGCDDGGDFHQCHAAVQWIGQHGRNYGQGGDDEQQCRVNFVSPGYFPLLNVGLAQGRIWDETENRNAAHVVVINQTLAQRYFPNGDALGHSMKMPYAGRAAVQSCGPGGERSGCRLSA